MRTYRDLFRTPEYAALFASRTLSIAGSTVGGLALGTLVFTATGSPLLSALSMFGPALAQVFGATLLMSAADRLPARGAVTCIEALIALGTAVLAIPGMPVGAMFAILFVQGVLTSLLGGVRLGLLNEILPRDGYLLGRSVLNMSVGTMQICGFAVGGVLLTILAPRGTLLAGAALSLAGAVIARAGLSARAPRASGRPSIAATWRVNARLLSSPPRLYVYLALWVPNGLIVGCESLFVSYTPAHAGTLLAAAAVGMLTGDTLMGRFVPVRLRERLSAPLRLLLAVPYAIFVVHPPLPLAATAAAVASIGYAASLLLQERLTHLTPEELSGHALGLGSSGVMAMQGVAAALAGTVAEWTSPGTAMAVMAALSAAITLALSPGLRPRPGAVPAEA